MIIQINATVCAAVDHGEDEQRKIADSDERRRTQKDPEKAPMTRRNNKLMKQDNNVGSSAGPTLPVIFRRLV